MTDYTYSTLAECQLIELYSKKTISDESINAEWFKRFSMAFPYRLDLSGNIVNCMMGRLFMDDECDKFILRQANRLRDERMKVFENNRVVD